MLCCDYFAFTQIEVGHHHLWRKVQSRRSECLFEFRRLLCRFFFSLFAILIDRSITFDTVEDVRVRSTGRSYRQNRPASVGPHDHRTRWRGSGRLSRNSIRFLLLYHTLLKHTQTHRHIHKRTHESTNSTRQPHTRTHTHTQLPSLNHKPILCSLCRILLIIIACSVIVTHTHTHLCILYFCLGKELIFVASDKKKQQRSVFCRIVFCFKFNFLKNMKITVWKEMKGIVKLWFFNMNK